MITIKEITVQNIFDVCELTTNPNGIGTIMEEYLCCNAISIAESKYFPEMKPQAIYKNEDLIGFFMYHRTDKEADIATICRFMIDYKFQGKGFGRASFESILQYLKNTGLSRVVLMIDEDNVIAKKLYISCGFKFTEKIYKDEHYYELNL